MVALVARLLGRRSSDEIGALVALAVNSLIARGIVDSLFQEDSMTLRLQWSRGNFGHHLRCQRNGWRWELVSYPITYPAGPYSKSGLDGDVVPLAGWGRCGKDTVVARADAMSHVERIEQIHALEPLHPVPQWISQQFEKLAKGKPLDNDTLQGLLLLGARRYFKTLPNHDRLQRMVEPALMTLLRSSGAMATVDADTNEGEQIVAGKDHAKALIEILQETYPLEARRAAHACFSESH